MRDLKTQALTLVSVAYSGEPADGTSGQSDVSNDGRFVAFTSTASNLTGRTFRNGQPQVYVRDLVRHATRLLSVSSTHRKGNAPSVDPSISGDGRHVAFSSTASNLAPDDTNDARDVFVRDTKSGTTVRGSIMPDGMQSAGGWGITQWDVYADQGGRSQMLH